MLCPVLQRALQLTSTPILPQCHGDEPFPSPAGLQGQWLLAGLPACPSPGSVNRDELLHSQLRVPRATGKPGPAGAVPSIAEGVVEPAWLPAAPQPRAVVALWSPSSWGSAGQGCWLGSASPLQDSHGREADWDRPVSASPLSCRDRVLPSDWWPLSSQVLAYVAKKGKCAGH